MDTIKCAFDGCESMATKKRRFCAHHVYSLRRKYYEEYRQNETRKSHQTWYSMIQRCYNAKHKSYSSYGGRGIKVCDRWRGPNGLENFRKDIDILHIDGVDQCAEVYLNGVLVGLSNNGYIPYSYDVSKFMVNGKNEIVIKVKDNQVSICKYSRKGRKIDLLDGTHNFNTIIEL